MKTLITVLIISSFLQSTILPLHLVLIILISRAFIGTDKANLFLAFGFGLLDSHLSLTMLGFISILYLIIVCATQVLSKSNLSSNLFLIIPLSFFLISIDQVAMSIFLRQSLELFPRVFLESLISLPIFYSIRLWEERFVIRKEIKLRI